MIVVRAPLRISFFGGGSDIPQFYQNHGGATLSTAIDKYVYICVKEHFDKNTIKLNYSKTEIVNHYSQLEHTRVKACLKHVGIESGIEIISLADIPSNGSGLGSSSSFTVALLSALYTYRGVQKTREELAREACEIEIQYLGEPIGKQDQYISSFGEIKLMEYLPDEKVNIHKVIVPNKALADLQDNLLMFYTGISRSANMILADQIKGYDESSKISKLKEMASMAREASKNLEAGNINFFGETLDKAWLLKKNLAHSISNQEIDSMYESAKKCGAIGGKILGAGGGGFLLLYAPRNTHEKIRLALSDYQEMKFSINQPGVEKMIQC